MKQGRGVDELDGCCEAVVAFALIAAEIGGDQRQHGAHALAAGAHQMAGEFRDQADPAFQPGDDQPIDVDHVGGHQPLDRFQLVAGGLGVERRTGSSQANVPQMKSTPSLS